jgi:hypothetical protein
MRSGFKSWLINVVCGLLAYAGSRMIHGRQDLDLEPLLYEILTFVALYLVLQLLVRGWAALRRSERKRRAAKQP